MTLSKKQELLIILFFSSIFAFFIFNHIGLAPFWLDEAATANLLPLNYGVIFSRAIADSHPLFYIFLLKTWSLFFGYSEFALRMFSAISALAILFVIYLFCRKYFNKKIAIIALALTSTSYFLIWFANENRPYTLAILLGLLSYFFFLEIIENPKNKKIIFYMLVTVCGFYTHPWFYFVFGSQILSLLLWHREKMKILLYQAGILFLAVPGILISFYQRNLGINSWINKPGLDDLKNSFHFFASNYFWIYVIISIIALSFGFLRRDNFKISNFQTKAIILYFFVPLVLAFVISQFLPIYIAGRYEIMVLPAFIILISILWSKIDFSFLMIVFILLGGLTANTVMNDRQSILSQKSSDKTIVTNVINKATENDLIITTDLSWSTVYYYVSRSPIQKNILLQSFPKEIESHPGWKNLGTMYSKKEFYLKEASLLAESIRMNEKIKQIWVFYNSNNEIDPPLIKELEKSFGSAEVMVPDLPRQNSWFDSVYLFKK